MSDAANEGAADDGKTSSAGSDDANGMRSAMHGRDNMADSNRLMQARPASSDGSLDEAVKSENQIDENLKMIYQQVVEEQVPDRFEQLLEQLRQQERRA